MLKRYVSELSKNQQIVYRHLLRTLTDDGSNIIDSLVEIDGAYQSVPDNILDSYDELNSIEKVEVIQFITKSITRNWIKS